METDWTKGRGLKDDGSIDPDWCHGVAQAWPVEAGWTVKLRWGGCWGHLAFGHGSTFEEALKDAGKRAQKDGMPDEWNPGISATEEVEA